MLRNEGYNEISSETGGKKMIKVKQVNHTFLIGKKGKEKKVPVLKGLSFEVEKEVIAILIGFFMSTY